MSQFGTTVSQSNYKVFALVILYLWLPHYSHTFSDVTKDAASGLCPSGYPKQVVYNGSCYSIGRQGPCGTLMNLFSNPSNPNYGVCKCQYDGRTCVSRPLIEWPSEGRCYYAFEQGPCDSSEWLTFNEHGNGTCEKNLCRQGKLEDSQEEVGFNIPKEMFWFSYNGTCYQTGTNTFCQRNSNETSTNSKDVVYFIANEIEPRCLEDAISCSTIDETEPRNIFV